jgi:hypothetical protein
MTEKQLLEWFSVGRLYLAPGSGRLALNGHEFHCGEGFEVFRPIHGTGEGRWQPVRIEHNSELGWYLIGDGRAGDELLDVIARRKA